MSSKILTDKGSVLSWTSVWLVHTEQTHDDTWKEKANSYTSLLTDALGARMAGIPPNADDDENVHDAETPEYPPYEDDLCNEEKRPEVDNYSHDGQDKLISAWVMLPLGDAKQPARVI